jgi:hypothetical protein
MLATPLKDDLQDSVELRQGRVAPGSVSPCCQKSPNLTVTLSGAINLPALPTAAAEAPESTATEASKSASLAEAVAEATAPKTVTKAATLTPTTEPIASTIIETTKPVLACAARLLFAVRP